MLEKGKQILMKDNLIDEERAKQEEAAQESLDQKLERLGKIDQSYYTSIMLLIDFYNLNNNIIVIEKLYHTKQQN